MKCFEVSSSKAALVSLVFIVGLGLGTSTSWAQRATTGDKGDITAPKSVTAPPTKGVVQVQVPDLIGKTEGEAKKQLEKLGLKLGKVLFTTSGKGTPNTVVRQKPTATDKVAKGSTVDLWVLKAGLISKGKPPEREPTKVSPKIVQKGKKIYMEFPETVKDVTISDEKGNKLQQFKKGKRFDVTESVIATRAGLIKVAWRPSLPDKLYMPGPPSGGTAVDTKHTTNFDSSRFINEDALRQKGFERVAKTPGKIPKLEIDDTFIENGEPGNNTIFYTLPGPKLYSGNVGAPGDPVDRLAFTSGPSPDGTVIAVGVVSGNVNVTLYYGSLLAANPLVENGSGFWIAVLPSDYIYFSVQPTGTGESPYTIAVFHQYILNPNEAQQTENNPMQLHLGGGTREGALIPRFGGGSDWEDWFFVQVPQSQRLRIMVTDAELPTYNRVRIGICPEDSNNAYEEIAGTYNEATLETWQSYPGTWKIRVDLAGPGVEFHGTGTIPSCYRKPYKIRVEAIP